MNDVSTSEVQQRFLRDGFVVVEGLGSTALLTAVNAEIRRHYASQRGDGMHADFQQFQTEVISWDPCHENNRTFCELRDMPRLQELTTDCLGAGWTASSSLVMLSPGGGKGQAWHQDCPPDNAQAFNLNRLFYTEHVSAADGAIVIVPGSHRLGRIPPGESQESLPGELVLEPRAGTLVLLHGHVFHRVTPNRTGKPRLSVNFRAFPLGISPDICNVGIFRNTAYDFRAQHAVQR